MIKLQLPDPHLAFHAGKMSHWPSMFLSSADLWACSNWHAECMSSYTVICTGQYKAWLCYRIPAIYTSYFLMVDHHGRPCCVKFRSSYESSKASFLDQALKWPLLILLLVKIMSYVPSSSQQYKLSQQIRYRHLNSDTSAQNAASLAMQWLQHDPAIFSLFYQMTSHHAIAASYS